MQRGTNFENRGRGMSKASNPRIPGSINVKEKNELSFHWQLLRDQKDQKKNRYVSKHTINAEWSLACWWSQKDHMNGSLLRPEFLEIRWNSTAMEVLVSVTFKLMRFEKCVLERKFKQLIEADSSTTIMYLEFPDYDSYDNYNWIYNSNEFFMSGSLTVLSNVEPKEYTKGDQFRSLQELSSNFALLLDPNETSFSDVNLKCGIESFSAHKNILCARSPVFATMFKTQMRENLDNKVHITDISPPILKAMLAHIYTGNTRELSVQSAGELLFAADKYQLKDLKRVCIDYLKSCVSAENVLRTLVLGYLHDNELKLFAMDFICNRCEEFEILEKTVEWQNLREKRPSLAMDVLTDLIKSKDQKLKRLT